MSDIQVVMIMPKKRPHITAIPNSTKQFEEIVGGPVDILSFHQQHYKILCNIDEGYDLTYNKKAPASTFFIAKYQGQFESLSDAETDEVKDVLRAKMKKWK